MVVNWVRNWAPIISACFSTAVCYKMFQKKTGLSIHFQTIACIIDSGVKLLITFTQAQYLSTIMRYFYFTGVFPIFITFTSTPLHLRGKYCTFTPLQLFGNFMISEYQLYEHRLKMAEVVL